MSTTEPNPVRVAQPGVTRRAAVGTLGAAALGFALWPRSPRSREGIPAGRTVIDYWEKWTGTEGEAVQRVVDRFNTEQTRIWVRRVPISDIMAKSMVAIAGGDPPDVVGLYSYNIPLFAESGAVYPLDDFGATHASLDAEAYLPVVRRLLSHEGRVWAGVTSCYSLALYINRRQFIEAGLNPDAPPRTTAELDAAADRLTVRDSSGRIQRAGFLPNMPFWWPYFWPVMFGGELYDAERKLATFADAAGEAAYTWVAGYPAKLGAGPAAEFANAYNRSFHSAQDPFFTGRVSMIVQGPWMANFMRHVAPGFEYSAAPVPVAEHLYDADRPFGLIEADVLMVPRGCRHPEEAFEFVRFTQRQDVQEQLASDHGKSSPLRAVSPEFRVNHPNRYVHIHEAIAQSPRVRILPQTRIWQQYADMTIGAFDAIWRGAPVPGVLKSVQTRAQQLIDHAQELRSLRGGLTLGGASQIGEMPDTSRRSIAVSSGGEDAT